MFCVENASTKRGERNRDCPQRQGWCEWPGAQQETFSGRQCRGLEKG